MIGRRHRTQRRPIRVYSVRLRINGQDHDLDVRADETLVDVLRRRLGLTGSKVACGRGECGACTVLVDGRPVLSCISLASRTDGDVETIEYVSAANADLCRSFADTGGFQCGFCTPGQLVCAAALLRGSEDPCEAHVRHAMSGNICRCTGYAGIVAAVVETAARRSKGAGS